MTKQSLKPGQRLTVEIIERVGFGFIERLPIRDGIPDFEPSPRIVQSVKVTSEAARRPSPTAEDDTLKKEFEILLSEIGRVQTGEVDIEIRHHLPFRLILVRRCEDFQP